MRNKMKQWKHVFKLDPAKQIDEAQLADICLSGTDAIIVGGTDNITLDGVLALLFRIKQYDVPCILEVSEIDAISPGFDHYFIPIVLNSTEKKWVMDIHHEAIKQYHHFIDWEEITMEGYCILNEQAKAYKKTNCTLLTDADVVAYAQLAEHVFHLPIFYIEYSGTYGDPDLVQLVKQELNKTILFYGGGITNAEEAKEMKQHADVIVVGNSIYTNFEAALSTVQAVKQ